MNIKDNKFHIDSCPHCQINKPNLQQVYNATFRDSENCERNTWYVFYCNNCYGLVTVETALNNPKNITKYFPSNETISEEIPYPAKTHLEDAILKLFILLRLQSWLLHAL